ncbi:MAG TPA: alanine--tRNA ligase [Acidimicrobiales bacterium]|nr:alanine--tRNA ligase [Acidimicrobiales bacterium]
MTLDANGLRHAFTRFFVERGHTALPAAPLIPHDPSVMFTIAGMVQFKPYFLGLQTSPVPRATTVQPCFRMVDIDQVGTTSRHNTFFEMLGNFSFGDYFKELAIPYAWEFVTEVLGLDPDRLWVTIHESDADASGIWEESTGVLPGRIQRMGADNFWKMGETGPCGPSSEIYYDRGAAYGEDGGPVNGADERYIEIWNLVFMQFDQGSDGSLTDLPRKNIDTGAGMERILTLLQGVDSVFETDLVRPLVEEASRLTGHKLGESPAVDVALRILADHARSMTMLVSDGVFPSNEGRGYTLRRVIRRAVMRAHQLGVQELVAPYLVSSAVESLKIAYPKLAHNEGFVQTIVVHEEEAFRKTIRSGTLLIEEELNKGVKRIDGDVAFKLHDTFGFPVDLTIEYATERGVEVDRDGFDVAMQQQRERARLAARSDGGGGDSEGQWRRLYDQHGPTNFVGYAESRNAARILGVITREGGAHYENFEGERVPEDSALIDVVLDSTPFYAEGGGQVGDSGYIRSSSATMRVLNTTAATEGLTRHSGYLSEGELDEGDEVIAEIDEERRNAIRRNHTATHLLQDALRRVLGDHVKQQGSLVAPDRLRFDFNHFGPLDQDERREIERLVNQEIISDHAVHIYETSKHEAEEAGAIAFFGDKYGETVRVVEASDTSVELCGGTHVDTLGMIGPFRILSEGSIGANTRRVEASTGLVALTDFQEDRERVERAATALKIPPSEIEAAIARLVEHHAELESEIQALRAQRLGDEARTLVGDATDGVLVIRRDSLEPNALRELALLIRNLGVARVALAGSPDDERVAIVVALAKEVDLNAKEVAGLGARLVGGGGGGTLELATAGGRDVTQIGAALSVIESALRETL